MNAHPAAPKKDSANFLLLLAIIATFGAVIIGYLVLRPAPAPVVLAPDAPLPKAEGHVMGSDSALVEIVEYGDFECPVCARFATVIEPDVRSKLVQTGLARFRFIDFPLASHPNTLFAHNAAWCAGVQHRFWEMHDRLYAGQPEWTGLGVSRVPNAARIMKGYARELALDTKAFDACLDARQFDPQIRANRAEGLALHVDGTPTFFVGNQMLPGALVPYDVFRGIVDSVTAQAHRAPPVKRAAKDTSPHDH